MSRIISLYGPVGQLCWKICIYSVTMYTLQAGNYNYIQFNTAVF